jgi:hypothetical protein
MFDIEMIKETGTCKGIENYSRHFDNRKKGEKAFCLLDYFGNDFILVIDESHQTLPQVRGMYEGDKQRKTKALSTPKKSKLDLADRVDYLNKLARGEISCSDDSDSTDDDDSQQEVEDDNENEEEAIDEEEVSEEDSDDDMEIDEEEQLAIALLKGKSPLDIPTATLQGEEGEEEQDETEEIELGEATRRLSILNCDWDNIRAEDIM